LPTSCCEERGLIPENTLANEIESARGHKYNKLKDLFLDVDKGGNKIPAFNGGLFKADEVLNSLNIDDQQIDSCLIAIAKTTLQKKPGVEIFGHIFEQSITDLEQEANPEMFVLQEGQVKKDGVVYTPEPITKFIVASTLGAWLAQQREKTGGDEDKYKQILSKVKVIDPACGSGAFLIAVFDFLVKEWQKFDEYDMHNHILQNNIFGVDINPISVEIAKLSLWLKTVDFKEKLANLDNQIKVGNSLVDDPNYAGGWDDTSGRVVYGTFKSQISFDETQKTKSFAFDWSKEFLPFLKDGGFDIVVGNPPYVRQELFSDVKPYLGFKNKQKQMRYEVFSGQADLYCYFYEKGLDLLKNGGKLGFITSNKWMRAKYGENLRKYLLSGYKIEKLIDLGGQKIFETVTVDTNIMVVKKAFSFHDYRISVGNNLDELTDFNPKYLSEKNFNINLGYDSNEIKTKMEKLGTPLKNWNVRINYGIKTGFNEAFIIDTKTRDELVKQDLASDDIIKPILRGRDIDRYGYEWAGLWLINSHNGYENIVRIDIEKDYPAIFKHLQKYQTQCQKRTDQGNHWTNLRSCAYIDDFVKERIVWQEIVQKPCFCYTNDKIYGEASSFVMIGESLKYLTAILNSKFCTWAFKKFYAGGGLGKNGFRYKKVFLEQIPIPKIDAEAQKPFEEKVDKMIEIKQKIQAINTKILKLIAGDFETVDITKLHNWYELSWADFVKKCKIKGSIKDEWLERFEQNKKDIKILQTKAIKIDNDIDNMVYSLYELTEDEIEMINK